MKKFFGLLIGFILILFLINSVLAENISFIKEEIEGADLNNASAFGETLKDKSNGIFDKEIGIFGIFIIPAKLFLGLSPGNIDVLLLIVMVLLFVTILGILDTAFGLFINGWKKWAINIVICMIMAIGGTFKEGANAVIFILMPENLFGDWLILKLGLLVLILGAIFIFFRNVLTKLIDKADTSVVELTGREIGQRLGFFKRFNDFFGKK